MSTELMIFFGVLFAALNVIDRNRSRDDPSDRHSALDRVLRKRIPLSKDWNIRDEKRVLEDGPTKADRKQKN